MEFKMEFVLRNFWIYNKCLCNCGNYATINA